MKIVEGHSSSTATTHTAGAEDPEVAKRAAIRPLLQRGRNERIGEFGLAKGPTHGDHDCLCKRIEARPRGNRFCSPAPPDVKRKTLMSEGRETKGEGGMGRGEREREKERERERRLERKSGSEAGRDAGRKTGWVRNVGSWSACLIFAISAPLKGSAMRRPGNVPESCLTDRGAAAGTLPAPPGPHTPPTPSTALLPRASPPGPAASASAQ